MAKDNHEITIQDSSIPTAAYCCVEDAVDASFLAHIGGKEATVQLGGKALAWLIGKTFRQVFQPTTVLAGESR